MTYFDSYVYQDIINKSKYIVKNKKLKAHAKRASVMSSFVKIKF